MLEKLHLHLKDIRVICNLYIEHTICMRTGNKLSDAQNGKVEKVKCFFFFVYQSFLTYMAGTWPSA